MWEQQAIVPDIARFIRATLARCRWALVFRHGAMTPQSGRRSDRRCRLAHGTPFGGRAPGRRQTTARLANESGVCSEQRKVAVTSGDARDGVVRLAEAQETNAGPDRGGGLRSIAQGSALD